MNNKKETINIRRVVEYWLKTAEKDWKFAKDVFGRRHYPHALFFAHLTLEAV